MTSSVVIVVVMNSSLTRVVGTAVMVLMTLPDSVMWVPMVSVTKVVKNLVSRVGTTTSVVMTVTTSSAGAAAPATTESGDSLRTVWCLIRTLSDSEGGKNEAVVFAVRMKKMRLGCGPLDRLADFIYLIHPRFF
ncbi:hypothetical protein C8Q70DRAFT_109467 [Cubamyces menziesii]|nr:hypothetical protein C8Q70DRAFT_109467 [Cubamyces menziesii]